MQIQNLRLTLAGVIILALSSSSSAQVPRSNGSVIENPYLVVLDDEDKSAKVKAVENDALIDKDELLKPFEDPDPKADSKTDSKADSKPTEPVKTINPGGPTTNQMALPVTNFGASVFPPLTGTVDRCYYSACNLPAQPQVAKGRCQACSVGIDCADNCGGAQKWCDLHRYNFQPLAHGEYLGPIRLPSTIDYRVRVGDTLRFIFIDSHSRLLESYRLMVGDELQITSAVDDKIKAGDLLQGRGAVIQPDGMLYLSLIGAIRAEGLTIPQLRHNLEIAYRALIKTPSIDVTPIKTNSLKDAILNAVNARLGLGGQNYSDAVHPDGTIRLPGIGAVCVQGLTLDEVKREINLRFARLVSGLEVEVRLEAEAQHFVYVYGEVTTPGRYQMIGPTSVTQALALAGGARIGQGANLREIVIFRRAEDWRMLATRVDIRGAHLGRDPMPMDEIWLRDGDTLIVPPAPIKMFNNYVRQVFTDGIYRVVPFGGFSISQFRNASIN